MSKLVKVVFAVFTLSLSTGALAGPITIQTDFSFDNFSELTSSGSTSPLSTVSGSFTLTFDPTTEVTDQAVTSISFDDPSSPFSTTGIRYSTTQILVSGAIPNFLLEIYSTDLPVALFSENDFLLQLAGFPSVGEPLAGLFLYSLSSSTAAFSSSNDTLSTVFNPSSSVPEPNVLLLLALGLLGLTSRAVRGKAWFLGKSWSAPLNS